MPISIEYKGWRFEFERMPNAAELESRYAERVAQMAQRKRVDGAEQGVLEGAVPLSPMQQWFLAQAFEAPHHWNHGIVYPAPAGPSVANWRDAWLEMLRRHDALRLRLVPTEKGWDQTYGPVPEAAFESRDFRDDDDPLAALAGFERDLHQRVSLDEGIAWLGHARLPDGDRLVIVVHHLGICGFSWPILAADLQDVAATLASSNAIETPTKGTSLRYWAQQLEASGCAAEAVAYWNQPMWNAAMARFGDRRADVGLEGNAQTVHVRVGAVVGLSTRNRDLRVAAIAAVASALWRWSGARAVAFDMEAHARVEKLVPHTDVSRTLGWFSSLFPVAFVDSGMADPYPAVRGQLDTLPAQTLRFMQGRFSGAKMLALETAAAADVLFNAFGRLAGEDAQRVVTQFQGMRGAANHRTHRLEVVAFWDDVDVHLTWTYSPEMDDRDRVDALAADAAAALAKMAGL